MEKYSGVKESKYLKSSNRGHTASNALLTVLVEPSLDWDEFETMPEELHLTNIEFEVFAIEDTNAFQESYLQQIENHHQKYDHKFLMLISINPSNFHNLNNRYDSIIILNTESLSLEQFDYDDMIQPEGFENEMDISIIEDLRFWINERI